MKIYLCGSINGCTDEECQDWREAVKLRLSDPRSHQRIDCIDPMRRDYRGVEAESYREIVDLDKRDVRSADALLVNYIKPSVGTSMEVFYAWTLGIPVVLWCIPGGIVSPWLRYHSTSMVHSLDAAIEKIREIG